MNRHDEEENKKIADSICSLEVRGTDAIGGFRNTVYHRLVEALNAKSTLLRECERERDEARSALSKAHHGDRCDSIYNTGKNLKDPRVLCDCYKKGF